MDKYVKYQSVQSVFDSSQNLVDFHVPQSGVYDLRDSHLVVHCKNTITEADVSGGVGVYDTMVKWNEGTEDIKVENSALVKNAVLDCANKGRIENLRRCDIYSQNIKQYDVEQRSKACESYKNSAQVVQPVNNQQYGIFESFNKTGIDKSVENNEVPITIPLRDIFDFADKASEYDTDRAGATRLHFECNFGKLAGIAAPMMADAKISASVKECNPVITGTPNSVVIGSNGTGTSIQTKFQHLNQSPYYVGQKLTLKATAGSGGTPATPVYPAVGKQLVVSSIIWSNTGTLTLSFETDWAVALTAGQSYHDITLEIVAPASVALTYERCELLLKRVDNPEGFDEIDYTTYSTEETNGNSQTAFRNIYVVEGEATNVLVFSPNQSDGLISGNNTYTDYRFSLNNIDLTNRNVVMNSPLYFDVASQSLRTIGKSLSNTTQNTGDTGQPFATTYTRPEVAVDVLCAPLFQTASNKLLQLEANATGGGVKAINLYKSLPRVFTY
jgi:hypothetical protein